ncbi:MAG: hypothetical protein HXS48_04695 [Theionarchaea archaeon]|nr:hypothetical protein [Theionarchaea archaeon]
MRIFGCDQWMRLARYAIDILKENNEWEPYVEIPEKDISFATNEIKKARN